MTVDYELVYSINTVSQATGNLMKVQDTHTHTHTHTQKALHTGRAAEGTQIAGAHTHARAQKALHTGRAAEGTQMAGAHAHTHTHTQKALHTGRAAQGMQMAGRVTVSHCNPSIPLLSHEAQGKKETAQATIVNIRQKTESISSMKQE